MDQIIIYVALALFGAILGSFSGATVWRLRARQLKYDKQHHETYNKNEYAKLKKLNEKPFTKDRSQCLNCGYKLAWYDLIPIISWLSLKGRCRSCRQPIGWFELIMEVAVALYFVLSYWLWPGGVNSALQVAHFVLWLAAGVALAIAFAYDYKWLLLPNEALYALAIIGLAIVGVSAAETGEVLATILSAVASVGVIGGLYGFLYFISRGRWVGIGDVMLGVALGLLLVDWQLAAVALFLANFIGCLIVIPLLLTKKLSRSDHVPFGPMLIAGTVLAWFFGWTLLEWYIGLLGF